MEGRRSKDNNCKSRDRKSWNRAAAGPSGANGQSQQQQQQQSAATIATGSTGSAVSPADFLGLPSTSSSSSSNEAPNLDDAYEYVKAQEESGFGDPLLVGDNCDNFDILEYLGVEGSDTPEGSPAAFCAPGTVFRHNPHGHQQQQLSELVHVLQAREDHHHLHHHNLHHPSSAGPIMQQPIVLDGVGLVMYNGGGTAGIPSVMGPGAPTSASAGGGCSSRRGGGPGQTRLLDSPPITDVSAGASSISPGSSGGGCDSASPFSPDQFRYVQQQQMHPQHQHPQHHQQQRQQQQMIVGGGGILLQQQQQQPMQADDMLLVNQMQLMGGHRDPMGGGLGLAGSTTESQLSPQSEFLSPYPPSQSTPGSQHSSQISPPAISNNAGSRAGGGTLSYLLQSQSAGQHFASSMDNLYTSSADGRNDLLNGNNSDMEQQQQQQQQFLQQQHQQGHKRRRMSSSATPGLHESVLALSNSHNSSNNNNHLPNVKSEIGVANGAGGGHLHSSARGGRGNGGGRIATASAGLLHQQQPSSERQSYEDLDENNMNTQRTIKFEPFMRDHWSVLYDANQQPLPTMPVMVVADKGFNFSSSDNCFVNQKKNHFQITVNMAINPSAASSPLNGGTSAMLTGGSAEGSPASVAAAAAAVRTPPDPFTPRYVRAQGGQLLPIVNEDFILEFCGVKNEMMDTQILIKQSQTDRKPVNHKPVIFKIDGSSSIVKQTVPRLHFSETTMNNHRKSGKPNPEQKFFLLVVKLSVSTVYGPVLVQAFHSDRVIVRASNPGQFEQPELEQCWKTQNGALVYPGQVCIGAGDKPIGEAQLTVHGNIATTGQITRPSDRRLKEDIADMSTTEAMSRVAQMRLVEYAYKPDIAQKWGLSEQDRHRVGVIAQELAQVLPEAVKDNGEFLTVDDTRIFYDTVAAAQELYRLTGNLECKIDQVEKISQKLARYAQKRRQLGSMASGLSDLSAFFGAAVPSPAAAAATGGVDNKSCVSYSHTSLASTGTSGQPMDGPLQKRSGSKKGGWGGGDKRQQRQPPFRCRSYSSASAYCNRGAYCSGADPAMCNSRFTQGTIVALVVIMALCLMAMCTLYVMDWYNRTYVYPFHHYHHPAHPVLPEHGGTPVPLAPDPNGVGEMRELLKAHWTPPINRQPVPPLTVHCGSNPLASLVAGPFVAPACPQYCCLPSAADNTLYERLGDKLRQGVDSLVSLATKAGANLFSGLGPDDNNSSPVPLGNGVHIDVLGLNMTLDARYCLAESCDQRTGRYNLYVPVSAQLPTMPLQLRVSMEDPTLLVDSCGSLTGFNHKSCELGSGEFSNADEIAKARGLPKAHKVTDNIFELTAGAFLQSAYKFRVGHSPELCQQDDKQRGRSFEEFNLIFYRTCQQIVPDAEKTDTTTIDEEMAGNSTAQIGSNQ